MTMKIRMLVEMSGSRNGRPWPPRGKVVDLPAGEAQHLVDSGIAEKAPEDRAPVETATPPKAEAAKPPAAETSRKPAAEKRRPGRPRKTQ